MITTTPMQTRSEKCSPSLMMHTRHGSSIKSHDVNFEKARNHGPRTTSSQRKSDFITSSLCLSWQHNLPLSKRLMAVTVTAAMKTKWNWAKEEDEDQMGPGQKADEDEDEDGAGNETSEEFMLKSREKKRGSLETRRKASHVLSTLYPPHQDRPGLNAYAPSPPTLNLMKSVPVWPFDSQSNSAFVETRPAKNSWPESSTGLMIAITTAIGHSGSQQLQPLVLYVADAIQQ